MTDPYRPISKDDYKPDKCETCEGSGRIKSLWSWYYPTGRPCSDCNGTGEKKDNS